MKKFLLRITKTFRPGLSDLDEQGQLEGAGDVLAALYTAPLALIGGIWLFRVTEWGIFKEHWLTLALFLGLMFVFSHLSFFLIIEIRVGGYANSGGSFVGMVIWSMLLMYGPTALWIAFLWFLVDFLRNFSRQVSAGVFWGTARSFMLYIAVQILGALIALSAYQAWGGVFPFNALTITGLLPALGAMALEFLWLLLVYAGYVAYIVWVQAKIADTSSTKHLLRFAGLALGLPPLAHPFATLVAGLYHHGGIFMALFLLFGLLLVAFLAQQLSRAAESSRQQSRQLEKLEQLGRANLNASPDASTLPDILSEHVPAMFPSGRIAIWVEPDRLLLNHPPEWAPKVGRFWRWMRLQNDVCAFSADEHLPWRNDHSSHRPLVVGPVFDVDTGDPLGGVYIELQELVQPWDAQTLGSLFPAVRALAAQVASALHQADVYAEALEHQQVVQELQLAGDIQASFLPDEMPILSGWELAVTIIPARETSGDFFDFIPLEDGRLGILIADVVDKGVGPALYMALSRTLIRTYAIEYEADPDVVFFATNNRILKDARASLFVTAFYGVLDQASGVLTYSNAGHNPPYLFRQNGGGVQALGVTGMPIGIQEEIVWGTTSVQLEPGDALILYTDGIPDAQDSEGEFFTEDGLVSAIHANMGAPAYEIQAGIIKQVETFVGEAPQFDDITLMILTRDRAANGAEA